MKGPYISKEISSPKIYTTYDYFETDVISICGMSSRLRLTLHDQSAHRKMNWISITICAVKLNVLLSRPVGTMTDVYSTLALTPRDKLTSFK